MGIGSNDPEGKAWLAFSLGSGWGHYSTGPGRPPNRYAATRIGSFIIGFGTIGVGRWPYRNSGIGGGAGREKGRELKSRCPK